MRNLVKILPILISLFAGITINAQDSHLSSMKGESSLGIGIGLPYGGLIGVRFGTNLADNLSLFGGLGYQIVGVGYNIGLLKDFESSSSTQFYLTSMYGTNVGIQTQGLSEYNELYTGVTLGAGIKINSRKTEGNFWDVGLLIPIRSSNFKSDRDQIKNDPRIDRFIDPLPVLITLGYNFNL